MQRVCRGSVARTLAANTRGPGFNSRLSQSCSFFSLSSEFISFAMYIHTIIRCGAIREKCLLIDVWFEECMLTRLARKHKTFSVHQHLSFSRPLADLVVYHSHSQLHSTAEACLGLVAMVVRHSSQEKHTVSIVSTHLVHGK